MATRGSKTSQIALTDLSLAIQMPYGPIRTDAASDEKSFVREFRISVIIIIFFFLFVFFFIFSNERPRASLEGVVSDFHTKLLHGWQRCASALSELPLSALGKLCKTANCFALYDAILSTPPSSYVMASPRALATRDSAEYY